MTFVSKLALTAAVLALAACGTERDKESSEADIDKTAQDQIEESTDVATEESTESDLDEAIEETAEEPQSMADTILAEAQERLGTPTELTLDMSSMTSFEESLEAMESGLDVSQSDLLQRALSTLAAQSGKADAMGAVTGIASGQSVNETLFKTMKDKLDGKSYEEILAMAG